MVTNEWAKTADDAAVVDSTVMREELCGAPPPPPPPPLPGTVDTPAVMATATTVN